MKIKVYVSGPYTGGDVVLNVRDAVHAADVLLKAGYAPYCPHLSHFWHLLYPHDYEDWLDLDMEWVTACDCMLRIPGISSGADRETEHAIELGQPVFDNISELRAYYEESSDPQI